MTKPEVWEVLTVEGDDGHTVILKIEGSVFSPHLQTPPLPEERARGIRERLEAVLRTTVLEQLVGERGEYPNYYQVDVKNESGSWQPLFQAISTGHANDHSCVRGQKPVRVTPVYLGKPLVPWRCATCETRFFDECPYGEIRCPECERSGVVRQSDTAP